jgi:hypothetical protein
LRPLTALLLLLPAFLLLGWFAYEQAPALLNPTPEWARGVAPGRCEAAATLEAYQAAPASADTIINAARAGKRMRQLAERRAGLPVATLEGPYLVRGTFPDAGERVAWAGIALLDAGEGAGTRSAVVYLDGETGVPLALVLSANHAGRDPERGCETVLVGRRALARRYAPLIGAVGWLGLAGVGWFIRNRIKSRTQKHRREVART